MVPFDNQIDMLQTYFRKKPLVLPFFPFALSHELVCKRGIMLPLRDIGCNRSSTNSIRCNCNKMLSTYHE